MDDPSRRTRPNEPPIHHTAGARYSVPDASQSNRLVGGAADRYRPGQLSASTSAPRGVGGSSSYSSYYQEPSAAFAATNLPSSGMSYGADYSPEQRQSSSNFNNYNSAPMMYNVPQPSTGQSQVYDGQNFGSRPSGGNLQIMTPDVASTYFGTETPTPSAPALQQAAHGAPASSGVYTQSANLNFQGSLPGMSNLAQPSAGADVSMTDGGEFGEDPFEARWLDYKRQMATVFRDISDGALQDAAKTLVTISDWLLSEVTDLGPGLIEDNASLQAGRLKLWEDFNHAWLALGLKQKEGMQSGQLHRSQTLLSKSTMQKMFDGLSRQCDNIEKHGLVDYQYGVWEERISEIWLDCFDLFPSGSEHDGR